MSITEENTKLTALEEILDNNGEHKPVRVCFVCTGNTCRSPMAAAVLNLLGKGAYVAESAGIAACEGDRIAENAVLALKDAGIESTEDNNYEAHRAKNINITTVEACDRLVAISASHRMALICAFPEAVDKISVMPNDIFDPFMYGFDVYRECLEQITDGIKQMFLLD